MDTICRKRIKRWGLAGSWTGLIYGTLYIARPVCEFFKQYAWFSFSVNALIILAMMLMAIAICRKGLFRQAANGLLFASAAIGYGIGILMVPIPEERLHFIEYGFLAYLVYRALVLDVKGGAAYLGALIIASLIGAGDEAIQYLLPNRYYQFQDVCLNSISAALGLVCVYACQKR